MPPPNSGLIPEPNFTQRGSITGNLQNVGENLEFIASIPAGERVIRSRLRPTWGTGISVLLSNWMSLDGGQTWSNNGGTFWDADVNLPGADDWLYNGFSEKVYPACQIKTRIELVKGNLAHIDCECVSAP